MALGMPQFLMYSTKCLLKACRKACNIMEMYDYSSTLHNGYLKLFLHVTLALPIDGLVTENLSHLTNS